MTNPIIVEEVPVTLAEVKATLEKNSESAELNFRANKTLEYLQHAPLLSVKDTNALVEELRAIDIPRMKDAILFKLADIRPTSLEELKGVLSAYALTISKENMDKLHEVLQKQ